MAEKETSRMTEYIQRRAESSRMKPVEYNGEPFDFLGLQIPYSAMAIPDKAMSFVGGQPMRLGLMLIAVIAGGFYIIRKVPEWIEAGWQGVRESFGLDENGNVIDENATGFRKLIQDTLQFIERLLGVGASSEPSPEINNTPLPSVPERNSEGSSFEVSKDKAKSAIDAANRTYDSADTRVQAVRKSAAYAARIVGIPESTLLAVANRESRMGKITNNTASSATTAWQLMPGTFNQIKSRYATQFPVLNKGLHDPEAAAVAAALYLKGASQTQYARVGRYASPTEQYIYYLMGHGGGRKFLEAVQNTPNKIAAVDWPAAAKANPSVFYDSGKPRTYKQIFEYLIAEVGVVAAMFEDRLGERKGPPIADTVPAVESPNGSITAVGNSTGSSSSSYIPKPVPIKVDITPVVSTNPIDVESTSKSEESSGEGTGVEGEPNKDQPQSFARTKQGWMLAL
jgi:hypothetical protein